jgi:hypothetical protein
MTTMRTKPLHEFMTTLLVSNTIQNLQSYCDGDYGSDDDVDEDDTFFDRSSSIDHTLAIVNMVSQLLDEEDPFLLPPRPHSLLSTSGSKSRQGSQESQYPVSENEEGDNDSLPSLDDCWSIMRDEEEDNNDDDDLLLRTLNIVVDNAKLTVKSAMVRTSCSCHCRNDGNLYSVFFGRHSLQSKKSCRWQSPTSRASFPVVSGDNLSLLQSPGTSYVCTNCNPGTNVSWASPSRRSRQDESPVLPRKISSSPRSDVNHSTMNRADARLSLKNTNNDNPTKIDQGESLVDMIQLLSVRAALALTNQHTSFGHDA